jgi:long-chain acyl-CoA synthetase
VQLVEGVEPGPDVEAELLAYCADNLAKYKVPRSLDFRRDFPRTETGKLLKRQLRDPFWAGHESQLV